ncbi:hypothetical protein D9M72_458990 [compost metagenome]
MPAKGVLNAAAGFAEFWAAWPSGPRKVAKQQCLNKWASFGCADSAAHILAHVEWMKKQADWIKDGGNFVPMVLTYLNQQRWIDWEAPKPVPRQPDALQKILSHKGAPIPAHVQAKIDAIKRQARGAQA